MSIDFVLTHAHRKFVYKLDINNHKTVSNEKDMNNPFSCSSQSLMNLNKTVDINSFLYILFHILMTKTNYDQLENFKRIEKSLVNPIAAFDRKYIK